MPMPVQKTALPVAGGALLIVAGIISITFWGFLIAAGSAVASLIPIAGLGTLILICGSIGVIFSLITLIGGVFGIQRKMWGLALTGSILGLFSLGWYFLGSLLSLIGLILIAISKKEFT